MDTSCGSCGKALAPNEILYDATARPLCQLCNDKAEVAKGLNMSRQGVDAPGAIDRMVNAREYEFDGSENAVISSLAAPMRFVGVMSLIFGIGYIILGLLRAANKATMGTGIAAMIEGVLLALAGAWLLPAASSFRAVVDTEGSDITNLMNALKKLRNVYIMQAIVWGLACAGIVIVIVLATQASGAGG